MSKSRVGAPLSPLPAMDFPRVGKAKADVIKLLDEQHAGDVNWREGRMWGNVYYADEETYQIAAQAYTKFMITNPYSKKAFPSFFKFETEVLAGIAELYGGKGTAAGSLTSGGTESNLLAMKTARDKAAAERPGIDVPEIVAPMTAHSSFSKAAQLFGMKCVRVPVGEGYKAFIPAMKEAINDKTVAIIGSAPGSPHGVIDPIPDLGKLAQERGLHLHVDACLGGFVVPFLKRLGYAAPDFDFRVPGVTSISVDPHKFGWSSKPCSVVLYRDFETFKHQPIEISDWSGGIHLTPNIQGSRAGGAAASIWAVMNYLGEEGFMRHTKTMMEITHQLARAINQIDGLRVVAPPETNNLCFEAIDPDNIDIMAVAEGLEEAGWYAWSRNQYPPSVALKVQPVHAKVMDAFLDDLKQVTRRVEADNIKRKGAATY